MNISSFHDLEKLGWRRRPNQDKKSYLRPNNRVVNKRRDLSTEEQRMFGDILFPGKRKFVSEPPSPVPSALSSPAPSSPAPSSPPSPSSGPLSPPTPSSSTQGRAGEFLTDRETQQEMEINDVQVRMKDMAKFNYCSA